MAYIGLVKPMIAQLNVTAGTYSKGFYCGEAVEAEISPQKVEGSLYGDDRETENVSLFKNATVRLETTRLPIEAHTVMFGHEETDGGIVYKTSDQANYVGVGIITKEIVDGESKAVAMFLPKVKFSDPDESYTTAGDSIEFKKPSISGKAIGDSAATWKQVSTFETEDEAVKWLAGKLNMASAGPTSAGASAKVDK